MRALLIVLPTLLLASVAVVAEEPKPAAPAAAEAKRSPVYPMDDENPMSGFTRVAYGQMKEWLLESAEKMPEEGYGWRPAESVRSFGQIVGHVAYAQHLFCAAAYEETSPIPKVEKTTTGKAELVAALKAGFAYCDRAYATLTDTNGTRMVKSPLGEMPKFALLTANAMHCTEHYGNMVTYLRIKGIVPPSSERPVKVERK